MAIPLSYTFAFQWNFLTLTSFSLAIEGVEAKVITCSARSPVVKISPACCAVESDERVRCRCGQAYGTYRFAAMGSEDELTQRLRFECAGVGEPLAVTLLSSLWAHGIVSAHRILREMREHDHIMMADTVPEKWSEEMARACML